MSGKEGAFPFLQDFNPGFTTTWFLSKNNNISAYRGSASGESVFGELRLESNKKEATFQLDHIPLVLTGGEYILTLSTRTTGKKNKLAAELIKMQCDSSGRFTTKHTERIQIGDRKTKVHRIRFKGVMPGEYILRLKGWLAENDASIGLSGFSLIGAGLAEESPAVQFAPSLQHVLFFPGQKVEIGAKVFLAQETPCSLSVTITDEQETFIARKDLGSFDEPGVYDASYSFIPENLGFFLAQFKMMTPHTRRSEGNSLQKSFSVIPAGDSPFMGLHCNGPDQNRKELILGRKAGFMHYRDHDFGAFTRWSRIQPGKKSHTGDPPPFKWHNDRNIAFITETMGYNYLGVLFQPPDWARDHVRSRADHPVHVPKMDDWRRYVREVVKRYSIETRLIQEWEVWNEGKGVTGKRLNMHSTYLQLLQSALEEIAPLEKKAKETLRIIAFGGIDRENIWRKVLAATKALAGASIHWKASRYRDTYFPVQKPARVLDKRFTRDGWPRRAQLVLQEDDIATMELWDTEGGLLNQNQPIYTFFSLNGTQYMSIADRQADKRYNPATPWNYSPVGPLEGAAIMSKQVTAHLASGVKRLYMYSFLPRDFVSAGYAPHMLEYDGSLKAYGHAYIIASKFLDDLKYAGRSSHDNGLVCENFTAEDNKVTDVCWNERESRVKIFFPENKMVYSMMGSPIKRPADGEYSVSTHPVFVTEMLQ